MYKCSLCQADVTAREKECYTTLTGDVVCNCGEVLWKVWTLGKGGCVRGFASNKAIYIETDPARIAADAWRAAQEVAKRKAEELFRQKLTSQPQHTQDIYEKLEAMLWELNIAEGSHIDTDILLRVAIDIATLGEG
jgi:hypothetical protein